MPKYRRRHPPLCQSHPHIAAQIVSPWLRKSITAGVDRPILFNCDTCASVFRKRVDNVVTLGRATCRECSASPDSRFERVVFSRTEAAMRRVQQQNEAGRYVDVISFSVRRNTKLTKAEVASVPVQNGLFVASRPLRWDITVTAKVRDTVQDDDGICRSVTCTQLLHIELDGVQHFRFSPLWHRNNRQAYLRSKEQDRVKTAVANASASSRYGRRFRRVSLLRLAMHRRCQENGDSERNLLGVIDDFVERQLMKQSSEDRVVFHPADAYSEAC